MIFKSYSPGNALQNFVRTYHVRHFEFPPEMEIPVKTFPPRAEHYILFYVKGSETIQIGKNKIVNSTTTLIGQYTKMVIRLTSPQFLIIQVAFFPGALFQLTQIPFRKFRDQVYELKNIYPDETREVDRKLAEAADYEQMINVVDNFLTDLFQKNAKITNPVFEKNIPHIFNEPTISKIEKLATDSCLSTRQFERLSQQYFGVSPKTMTRIIRFNNSYTIHSRNLHYSWPEVAIASGYTDYQHMVRDYKDFAGITPSKLWESDLKAPDRVLGLR